MSRRCELTGKRPMAGNNVSHAHRKTRRVQRPNLQRKRIFVPELGRWVRLRVSTRALRSIDKKGLIPFIRETGVSLKHLVG